MTNVIVCTTVDKQCACRALGVFTVAKHQLLCLLSHPCCKCCSVGTLPNNVCVCWKLRQYRCLHEAFPTTDFFFVWRMFRFFHTAHHVCSSRLHAHIRMPHGILYVDGRWKNTRQMQAQYFPGCFDARCRLDVGFTGQVSCSSTRETRLQSQPFRDQCESEGQQPGGVQVRLLPNNVVACRTVSNATVCYSSFYKAIHFETYSTINNLHTLTPL